MRASLDTNVIIHLYRADLQNIVFDFFKDGVYIYEQIRKVELEHHGQDVLSMVDADELQTIRDFNSINEASDLKWSFRSQIAKFIKRFWSDPYNEDDKKWMQTLTTERNIKVKSKFNSLRQLL